MLPGLSGHRGVPCSCAGARTVPVIMLTAKDSEIDKVVGLEIGADDYVTKPFSSRELVARIQAVLRRRGEPEELLPATLEAGPVRMDVDRHVVTVAGASDLVPLKEFELLEMLLRNAGRVLTRMQLIDRVWGSDYVGDTKTLDVHVKRLRAKIEPDPGAPRYLVTVRGLGLQVRGGLSRGRTRLRRCGSAAGRRTLADVVSRRRRRRSPAPSWLVAGAVVAAAVVVTAVGVQEGVAVRDEHRHAGEPGARLVGGDVGQVAGATGTLETWILRRSCSWP